MKITFLVLLLAFCLNNLTATSEEETSGGLEEVLPVFAFNREALVKPTETACMQWLELLEIERNKADTLGNFLAFKAFTKEISATIGGKYGFSIPSTHEETIALSYSIIRTRHKFCGKRNMLSDFYGVGAVADDLEIQHYLSLVLAIDTMAAKAINDEDDTFFDQWTAVSQTGSTHDFIEAVRNHTQYQEKASLFTALDEPLTAVLTDRETIATVKDVFDIFAPKITLKKIYTEMIGGEYRGWTIHGADAFAYPISLNDRDREQYSGFEAILRGLMMQSVANQASQKQAGLSCCSVVACLVSSDLAAMLSLSSENIILDYISVSAIDEALKDLIELEKIPTRHIFLTRKINPALISVIGKPFCKVLSENTLDKEIKRSLRVQRNFMMSNEIELGEDFFSLLENGNTHAILLYSRLLFNGIGGVKRDISKAVEILRDPVDLGCDEAMPVLSEAIYDSAVDMLNGRGEMTKDIPLAIALVRESKALGSERAQKSLPSILNHCVSLMVDGKEGFAKNPLKALVFCKEAKNLGSRDAERNLPICLEFYRDSLFYGQNGVAKDAVKAIDICKKMIDCFGRNKAEQQLPIYLFNYGVWLYNGEEGIARDIPCSIENLKESADLGFTAAKELLPSIMFNYAIWLSNGENDIAQDMQKAVNFCRESADLGCEGAKEALPVFTLNYGLCLFRGENGIKKDLGEASRMFKESSDLGNAKAKTILGELQDFISRDNTDIGEKLSIEFALGFSRFGKCSETTRKKYKEFNGFLKLDDIIDEVLKYAGVAQATKKFNDKQSWISDREDEEDDDEF
ncbi:MAG: sel1 repeat family protein [Proteobacteria bacterium]|nr:sel1 repeat family protein [Pseudomonadota bacterium]